MVTLVHSVVVMVVPTVMVMLQFVLLLFPKVLLSLRVIIVLILGTQVIR